MAFLDEEAGLISKAITGRHCFYLFKNANQLSQTAQQKIKSDISSGMIDVNVEEYFKQAGDIFSFFDYLLVVKNLEDESVNGIFTCRWIQTNSAKMLYIYTTKVISDYQRTSLFASMVSCCFDGVKSDMGNLPQYVLFKTVNPIVYRYTKRISEATEQVQLYPNIPTLRSPEMMLEIAKEGAAALCPDLEFNVETGVIRDAMKVAGEGYYPTMVECGSKVINEFFNQYVTLDDQILGIIYIPEKCEKKFLTYVRNLSVFKDVSQR